MLHRRRQRLKELTEREAAGENFWTDEFDTPVRQKILYAFDDNHVSGYGADRIAHGKILRDEGWGFLVERRNRPYDDLVKFLDSCESGLVPTVIEAMLVGILGAGHNSYSQATRFVATVRETLREHRVGWDLVEAEMIPLRSFELHTEVVEPTIRLLTRSSEYPNVEESYRAALGEIADGNAADAITDAGTALQEMLTALGCKGNSLGPLIRSAKDLGFLSKHDGPLTEGIEKVLSWVSADRSELGDSHKVTEASISDAWLIVHIVGAVILRLADPTKRG